jgi:transcription-repair coupling factor (superfamily II helicase)
MNLQELLARFHEDARIKTIAEKINAIPPARFFLKGIVGSAGSFIAASLYKLLDYNHVFILNDKEGAVYFQNSLQDLLDKKDIFYFPDSFKRPGKLEEVNTNNILLRTETVNRLTNSITKAELVVTYPEALFEKVVQKEVLQQNMLFIKINEKLVVDFMIELLVTYGFERVDFVYEPGTFSVRGDIVDIFSFGNELPYRIELFGNEVESIRTFNPESQLSDKKIAQVTIVPNIQSHFTTEQKTSFFSLLPEKTIIWLEDIQLTADVLERNFEEANRIYLETKRKKDPLLLPDNHKFFDEPPHITFEKVADFLTNLQKFPVIEFGLQNYFQSAEKIQFHFSPQPVFHKNFNLLIESLKENETKGITTYIFSENPKQIERLYHIFDDLEAETLFHPIPKAIHEGFIAHDLKVACYTDHQIFNRYHKYRLKEGFTQSKAQLLKTLRELQPGDYVTHIDFGIGIYSGLEKINVNGKMQEAVRLVYRDNDLLYVSINSLHKISKYSGKEGTTPKINKLGTDAWETLKRKTKRQIKDIAEQLIKLYAQRKAQKGFAFSPDNYLQNELEASFMYEDTPDQEKATNDFKRDMESPVPMDRLVCGDVGFGKTEIAIRAAFKAVCDSKQVAVLVPTTILCMQHLRTFTSRLEGFPVTIDYINRFKSAAERKETLQKLAEGKIDIIIGTHAILNKEVKFKDLGLLIVDEEQKFGVAAKEKLRELKVNVDTLTLTATPIPRTLQFSLMGARDLSIIRTPPPNRQPIQTELCIFNDQILRDAIEYEVYRGGQVFFVHNRVKDIYEMAAMLQKLCPTMEFGIAHGQMPGNKLEEVMLKFINKEYDVLVCTNIIESGLDVPNANTIIINNAHMFGLSELHQLRGRVGRSNKKAFCYLFSPPLSSLTPEARRRLKTIEEFADLGSGFNISLRDMDIRGAGNLLGAEQSGFIAEIGFDMYHKILDEAIRELKTTEYKDLYQDELEYKQDFVRDCQIDTDLEMLIPDYYIRNINERLSIYTELDNIENEEKLQQFKSNLKDRFGNIPPQVEELCNGIRLRWVAKKLGFEKIILKHSKLKCYFPENPESSYYTSAIFDNIMQYIQQHPLKYYLKQTSKSLILSVENVNTMHQASDVLQEIWEAVYSKKQPQS